jgi:hypothetical protein
MIYKIFSTFFLVFVASILQACGGGGGSSSGGGSPPPSASPTPSPAPDIVIENLYDELEVELLPPYQVRGDTAAPVLVHSVYILELIEKLVWQNNSNWVELSEGANLITSYLPNQPNSSCLSGSVDYQSGKTSLGNDGWSSVLENCEFRSGIVASGEFTRINTPQFDLYIYTDYQWIEPEPMGGNTFSVTGVVKKNHDSNTVWQAKLGLELADRGEYIFVYELERTGRRANDYEISGLAEFTFVGSAELNFNTDDVAVRIDGLNSHAIYEPDAFEINNNISLGTFAEARLDSDNNGVYEQEVSTTASLFLRLPSDETGSMTLDLAFPEVVEVGEEVMVEISVDSPSNFFGEELWNITPPENCEIPVVNSESGIGSFIVACDGNYAVSYAYSNGYYLQEREFEVYSRRPFAVLSREGVPSLMSSNSGADFNFTIENPDDGPFLFSDLVTLGENLLTESGTFVWELHSASFFPSSGAVSAFLNFTIDNGYQNRYREAIDVAVEGFSAPDVIEHSGMAQLVTDLNESDPNAEIAMFNVDQIRLYRKSDGQVRVVDLVRGSAVSRVGYEGAHSLSDVNGDGYKDHITLSLGPEKRIYVNDLVNGVEIATYDVVSTNPGGTAEGGASGVFYHSGPSGISGYIMLVGPFHNSGETVVERGVWFYSPESGELMPILLSSEYYNCCFEMLKQEDVNNDGEPEYFLGSISSGQAKLIKIGVVDGEFRVTESEAVVETSRQLQNIGFSDYDGDSIKDVILVEAGHRSCFFSEDEFSARIHYFDSGLNFEKTVFTDFRFGGMSFVDFDDETRAYGQVVTCDGEVRGFGAFSTRDFSLLWLSGLEHNESVDDIPSPGIDTVVKFDSGGGVKKMMVGGFNRSFVLREY